MKKNDKGRIHNIHTRSLVNFLETDYKMKNKKKEPDYEYISRQTRVKTQTE
jgi:hypothetical protein